jgi:hypothetical protein
VLTAWIAYANWQSARTADATLQNEYHKLDREDREKKEYAWQKQTVYDIIDKGMKASQGAVAFQDIQNQYVAKAVGRKTELSKDKLTEEELNGILMDLLTVELIYRTVDDRYLTKRVFLMRGDNTLTQNSTANAIMRVLVSERGTKTVDELRAIVTRDGTVTADDYNFVIAAMMAPSTGMIKLENGKVYAIQYPPEKK